MKAPTSARSPLIPSRHWVPLTAALCLAATGTAQGNWSARPLSVHEWGVNTFDWESGKRLAQDLPAYLYTDEKPGRCTAKPEQRVRDLPADSGRRTKPILYFYPEAPRGRGMGAAEVGIEMRFAYGHANAWWPQVTQFRTEGEVSKAGPPEGDGREASMQLVWDRLTLHEDVPAGQKLRGEALPADHWAKVAREVDAAYVSNGSEVERYVFYEGKTREIPVIALLPADPGMYFLSGLPRAKEKEVAVVNIGKHPIHDVIAVYRDSAKGILWAGFIPMLPALPSGTSQVAALRIPDFSMPRPDDKLALGADEFRRRTKDRLLENLTAGFHYQSGEIMMRNPADPQGPTRLHQLYRKEAVALEQIWHEAFFESEGLTILYRESPAYLDEAMPLHIYTSMFWFVKLSRCGLVLNRNLPINEVHANDEALETFELAFYNKHMEDDAEKAAPQLRKHRFVTLGQARFRYGQFEGSAWQVQLMEKVRELFE